MTSKRRSKRKRTRHRRDTNVTIMRLTLAVVVLFAGVGFGLYWWIKHQPKMTWVKADCALVVDRSLSASNPAVVSEYESLAKSAVKECAQHGANLTIVQVSSYGASGSSQIVSNKTFVLNQNGLDQFSNQEVQSLGKSHADQAINSLFGSPITGQSSGSDIVGAINQAGSTLLDQTTGAKLAKYLVVLTDGLQDTADISVGSLSLTDGGQALVNKTNELYPGLGAGLAGANVSFYGVGGKQFDSNGQAYSQLFQTMIRSYWLKLVQENGGAVCAYSTSQVVGNVLLNCGD